MTDCDVGRHAVQVLALRDDNRVPLDSPVDEHLRWSCAVLIGDRLHSGVRYQCGHRGVCAAT